MVMFGRDTDNSRSGFRGGTRRQAEEAYNLYVVARSIQIEVMLLDSARKKSEKSQAKSSTVKRN